MGRFGWPQGRDTFPGTLFGCYITNPCSIFAQNVRFQEPFWTPLDSEGGSKTELFDIIRSIPNEGNVGPRGFQKTGF